MPHPTQVTLPLELCELVIDSFRPADHRSDFHPHTPTLRSCCQVCRAWLACSRQNLYLYVWILNDISMRSFLDVMARSPHLQGLTKRMFLKGDSQNVGMYNQLFLRGQKLLPKLHTLKLSHIPSALHPSLLSIHRPFPNVKFLNIGFGSFCSLLDLRRLFESFFPNLSNVQFINISLQSSHVTLPHRVNKRLQALSLSYIHVWRSFVDDDFVPVQRWLSMTKTISSIRTLHIEESLLSILPTYGRFLTTLKIDWHHRVHIAIDDLSVNMLPALETLRFNCFADKRFFSRRKEGRDRLRNTSPLTSINSLCPLLQSRQRSSFKFLTGKPDESVGKLSHIAIWFEPYMENRFIAVTVAEGGKLNRLTVFAEQLSLLDDTLSSIPSLTRVEILEEYWEALPKLCRSTKVSLVGQLIEDWEGQHHR